jgi:hypothetical protein
MKLRGYEFEQVERAVDRLLQRHIIRHEGIRYVLSGS